MQSSIRVICILLTSLLMMSAVSCSADNTIMGKQDYVQVLFQDADTEETLMSMSVVKGDAKSVITEDDVNVALEQLPFSVDNDTKNRIVMQLTDMIGVPIEDDVCFTIEGLNPNSNIK
jgi:hypothetical protein